MIVHIGVVVIAVAFAASHSFGHRTEVSLRPGQSRTIAGHSITYLGTSQVSHPNRQAEEARVRIDGKVYRPAISQYVGGGSAIGTPSVHSTPKDDVYVTLVDAPQQPGDAATIGVIVQPLIMWLWIGGGIIVIGTLMAAWPGRRRRPTAPVSAPVPVPPLRREVEARGEPIGAGLKSTIVSPIPPLTPGSPPLSPGSGKALS
jgi:cytochrome c-type biogenesis protein CcmF